jgi:hypothetical protein
MVDTQVSGTCGGNPVEVQVLFSAIPQNKHIEIILMDAQ